MAVQIDPGRRRRQGGRHAGRTSPGAIALVVVLLGILLVVLVPGDPTSAAPAPAVGHAAPDPGRSPVPAGSGVAVGVDEGAPRGAPDGREADGGEVDEPRLFAELESRYGIEVRHDVGEGFFPAAWAGFDPAALAADADELARLPAILGAELARYPTALVRESLRRICVAARLSFGGVPFGGTADLDSVYLTVDGAERGYTDDFLRTAFHHELSTILLHRHGFDEAAWRACNDDGFVYSYEGAGGGVAAIERDEDGMTGEPRFWEAGFLVEYGRSEFEQDFNTYCELWMTDPDRLRSIAAMYPRVAAKAALCRDFYRRLGVHVR